MKVPVSYSREMRDRAALEGKALYTIDISDPMTPGGKRGGRMTMQGPSDAKEANEIREFMYALMAKRAERAQPAIEPPKRCLEHGGTDPIAQCDLCREGHLP